MKASISGSATTTLSEFTKSSQFRMALLTNIVNLLHSPPYIEYQFIMLTLHYPVRYSLSNILSNLIYLRLYLCVRLIATMSQWTDVDSEEACEKEGFQADFYFAIKSVMKERPYVTILANFTVSTVVFGLSMRTFER